MKQFSNENENWTMKVELIIRSNSSFAQQRLVVFSDLLLQSEIYHIFFSFCNMYYKLLWCVDGSFLAAINETIVG